MCCIHNFSPESVDLTVKELEENLQEGKLAATGSSRMILTHAKVVGIPCDVSEPDDVGKLASFAVSELGSIDIWVSFSVNICACIYFIGRQLLVQIL